MGAQASAEERREQLSQDRRTSEVILHCYDYFSSEEGQALNGVLRQLGTGAFHCGVEVYGREYSFRGKYGLGTGVFAVRPRTASKSYREAVKMGTTLVTEEQFASLLKVLMRDWQGNGYDLFRRNCCHFSDELCKVLGVGGIPEWITNLADTGKAIQETLQQVEETSSVASQSLMSRPVVVPYASERGHYDAVTTSDPEHGLGTARELERYNVEDGQGSIRCLAIIALIVVVGAFGLHVRQVSLTNQQRQADNQIATDVGGSERSSAVDGSWRQVQPTNSGLMDTATSSDVASPGDWEHEDHQLPGDPYRCQNGNDLQWSSAKSAWCCREKKMGCRFDCNSDYSNFEHAWSRAKRDWCCEHEQLGCRSQVGGMAEPLEKPSTPSFPGIVVLPPLPTLPPPALPPTLPPLPAALTPQTNVFEAGMLLHGAPPSQEGIRHARGRSSSGSSAAASAAKDARIAAEEARLGDDEGPFEDPRPAAAVIAPPISVVPPPPPPFPGAAAYSTQLLPGPAVPITAIGG